MHEAQEKLLLVASGTSTGGGTGAAFLANCCGIFALDDTRGLAGLVPLMSAGVGGIMSNHRAGGVRKVADSLHLPFFVATGERSYHEAMEASGATLVVICGWTRKVPKAFPLGRTVSVIRGSGGREGYRNIPQLASKMMMSGGELHSEIVARFVAGPTANDGPVIVRIPVTIRVGPDFQLPKIPGLKNGDARPTFDGTVPERMARICRYWFREQQQRLFPQVLEQVVRGNVSWSGRVGEPVKMTKLFVQSCTAMGLELGPHTIRSRR